MNPVPYWGFANFRGHRTKFSRPGDLAPGMQPWSKEYFKMQLQLREKLTAFPLQRTVGE